MLTTFRACLVLAILITSLMLGVTSMNVHAETTGEAAATITPSVEETQLLALINEERAKVGQPPLEGNISLLEVARIRSHDMATRNYFSHTTPEGTTFINLLDERSIAFQLAGETLQRNNFATEQTVGEAFRSLMASEAHRTILLDGRFQQVGIGHAANDSRMNYFTVVLIQP